VGVGAVLRERPGVPAPAPAAAADAIRSARSVPGYHRHQGLLARWRDIGRAGHRTGFTGAWLRGALPATGRFRSMCCAVAMDRAGNRIVRSDEHGTIEVWELDRGLRRIRLDGHDGRIPCVALDETGRLALSAGEDASVRLWDLPSGRCARVLRGHDGPVEAVAMDAGGRVGFSVGADMLVRVWDLATGECRAELSGHTAEPTTLAADRDGRHLVTASRRGEEGPRLWDVAAGRCLRELPLGATTLSPDGTALLSGHDDGGLQLWDPRTGERRRTLHAPDGSGKARPLWTDGDTAVASREGGGIEVWDLHAGRRIHRHGQLPPLRQVSPDGRFGVSGDFDMLVRVWDVRSGGQLAMLDGHDEVIAGALLTDDGHILASFDVAGHIVIWDLDWDYAFTPPPDRF
jgi:WD40 repeat protein